MRFIVGESFSYHPKIMIRQSWPLTLKGAPVPVKKGKDRRSFGPHALLRRQQKGRKRQTFTSLGLEVIDDPGQDFVPPFQEGLVLFQLVHDFLGVVSVLDFFKELLGLCLQFILMFQ